MKQAIASLVHRASHITGLSSWKIRNTKVARILMFHGVGDEEYPTSIFEEHLEFLTNHFSVISLESLARKFERKERMTNELVLTFDDGLRNNLLFAYPVLKRVGVPATFFVCPGLIEARRWLWNHEARARLQGLAPGALNQLHARIKAACRSEVEPIISWMKRLSSGERCKIEEVIRNESSSFDPSPVQRQRYDLMNWDELRSLDPELITVGSHTVNHPILSTLKSAELEFEMAESRRILEEKLQRKIDQFCYPNGSHNPEVIEAARRHYRIAVTTEPGFIHGNEDLLQLPRLGIVPQPLLSWRLHRPTA